MDTTDKKRMQELNEKTQKHLKLKYCCAPNSLKSECSKKIINAHTISRCLGLNKISEDGHVYGIEQPNFFKLDQSSGKLIVKRFGCSQASTFTMFCGEHDKQFFSPFEDRKGDEDVLFSLNSENCFLLAYRSLCLEYFKANYELEDLNSIDLSHIPDMVKGIMENIAKSFIAASMAKKEDLKKIKTIFDSIYIKKTLIS